MSIVTTFEEAADLVRRNVFALLVICAIVFVPVDLLVAVIDEERGWGDASPGRFIAATLVLLIAGAFAYAAAIAAVSIEPEAEEEPSTPVEALRDAGQRLGVIVVLTVVAGIGVVVGFALLVIPGLVLLTWWLVAYQAAMVEARGWRESLGRSRELVRGNFWPALLIALVVLVLAGVVDYAAWRVAVEALPDRLGAWIAGVVADTVITAASVALTTAAYWQLNERSTLQES